METIIASAIAVLGTLLGSGLTLAFQQRTTDKGHQFTRHERLRQERWAFDAYTHPTPVVRRELQVLA